VDQLPNNELNAEPDFLCEQPECVSCNALHYSAAPANERRLQLLPRRLGSTGYSFAAAWPDGSPKRDPVIASEQKEPAEVDACSRLPLDTAAADESALNSATCHLTRAAKQGQLERPPHPVDLAREYKLAGWAVNAQWKPDSSNGQDFIALASEQQPWDAAASSRQGGPPDSSDFSKHEGNPEAVLNKAEVAANAEHLASGFAAEETGAHGQPDLRNAGSLRQAAVLGDAGREQYKGRLVPRQHERRQVLQPTAS